MSWTIKKEEKYSLYTPLDLSEEALIDAFELLDSVDNKIVDCSKVSFTEPIKQIVLKIYEAAQKTKQSFIVVVGNKEALEDLEELFVVVPTISEAIDYIYMEELERNF